MEIKIQISGRVFSITIGRGSKWFAQDSLIMVVEEFYYEDTGIPDFSELIFSCF